MSINTLAVEMAAKKGAGGTPPSQDDRLAALTKYIPTESITLYVATVAAQETVIKAIPFFTQSFAYKLFIGITPVLMLILFLRKLAVAKKKWKLGPSKWPWWRIVAATIAFVVWGLAVPGSPTIIPNDPASNGVLAGLGATFVSTVLTLFEPFFERNS